MFVRRWQSGEVNQENQTRNLLQHSHQRAAERQQVGQQQVRISVWSRLASVLTLDGSTSLADDVKASALHCGGGGDGHVMV